MPAASPAPGLNASWNANARTPVSKREKVLLQPDFDISMRASSPAVFRGSRNTNFCSTHGFYKERVGGNRVPRPDEQRWSSYREQRLHHAGGKRTLPVTGLPFANPRSMFQSRIFMHHSLTRVIAFSAARSSTYLGPAPLLHVGDVGPPSRSRWGETHISLKASWRQRFSSCWSKLAGPVV